MAAPVPPRGGARGSAASPSRSARFRGVGRDKMASPPPLSAARPGRSHGRASELYVEGARRAGTRPPPGAPTPRFGPGRGRPRRSREPASPCYITPGSRAAPARATFFSRALSRRRARCLRRTQGRTTRPSLAPSPLRPASAHARARACRARGGGAREGEAAGALPAAF